MEKVASESAVFYDHFFTYWHVGDLAGIVGVLLALIGFGVTFYQVSGAKSAAEAAQDAANAALSHRRTLDSTAALTECIAIIREIKAAFRNNKFEEAIHKIDTVCDQIRHTLSDEIEAGHNENSSKLEEIRTALRDLQQSTLRLVEKPEKLRIDVVNGSLSAMQDKLGDLSGAIRNARGQANGN